MDQKCYRSSSSSGSCVPSNTQGSNSKRGNVIGTRCKICHQFMIKQKIKCLSFITYVLISLAAWLSGRKKSCDLYESVAARRYSPTLNAETNQKGITFQLIRYHFKYILNNEYQQQMVSLEIKRIMRINKYRHSTVQLSIIIITIITCIVIIILFLG